MRLRDNLALLPAAAVSLALETYVLMAYRFGLSAGSVHFRPEGFLLAGQVYVLAASAASYLLGRWILRPLTRILDGITLFAEGRMSHRIEYTRIREFDRLAEHLNRMAAKLGELDGLKNEFVANVSHELRSPLAAMEGYVTLLLAQAESPSRERDNLTRISANLTRLRHLVENLLDLSKIEARRLEMRLEPFSAAELVREVCALFAPKIQAHRLSLATELPPDLPPAQADPAKARQVLINLLDNAIKYNRPDGTVSIWAAGDRDTVTIGVRDSGHGIAAEHLDSIFERFRRAPPTEATAKVKGVGLGLAISRSLALAMGGDLRVESRLGSGSTFTFILPAGKAA